MSHYSIKDLERYSGIKAHTLRIWEQRYKLLRPNRTETNIRTYCNADLRQLLNISTLNAYGIKISAIAKMSTQEIHNQVIEITENTIVPALQIENFIKAMVSYDEILFEKTFELCCKKIGFNQTMTDVVYPFLQRLGVMWHAGMADPGQEHFIIHLIRQKLILVTNQISPSTAKNSKKIILFLPENEYHEIAILYYNFLLRSHQFTTYYFGQSVPFEDLQKAYQQIQPEYLLTIITCPKEQLDTHEYLKKLASNFSPAKIFISGAQGMFSNIKVPKNIQLFKNPIEFEALLNIKN
jgi:MerR family transcriptional regulator, light-induced transcriptional regulator